MKKAVAAALLLSLLLGAAFANAHYLDAVTEKMIRQAEICRAYCRQGDMDSAESALSKAMERWERLGTYARIFLRQTEIDAIASAEGEVLDCLRGNDAPGAEAALDRLERRLTDMAEMERVTLQSVF